MRRVIGWSTDEGFWCLEVSLCGLNTLDEQRKLLGGVHRLHSTIRLIRARIDSLQPQISSHPAELESVRSEFSRLEASLEGLTVNYPLLRSLLSWQRPSVTRIGLSITLRCKSFKMFRRYWLRCGAISTIMRPYSVPLTDCFVKTSVALCTDISGLFLTLCRSIL